VDSEPSFWQPEIWREKAINKKQGSLSTGVANQEEWSSRYERICALACGLYEDMISSRICPEQARLILPQSAMTSWIWSGSLYAFSRVYALRITPDAQKETRDAAREIGVYAKELFPYSWEALTGER
jgi:thymidylate synthase (FAD)